MPTTWREATKPILRVQTRTGLSASHMPATASNARRRGCSGGASHKATLPVDARPLAKCPNGPPTRCEHASSVPRARGGTQSRAMYAPRHPHHPPRSMRGWPTRRPYKNRQKFTGKSPAFAISTKPTQISCMNRRANIAGLGGGGTRRRRCIPGLASLSHPSAQPPPSVYSAAFACMGGTPPTSAGWAASAAGGRVLGCAVLRRLLRPDIEHRRPGADAQAAVEVEEHPAQRG